MKYHYLIFFVILMFVSKSSIYAQNSSSYKKADDDKYIGRNIWIFEGNSDSLSITEVIEDNKSFIRSKQSVPNFGVSKKSHWVKFRIVNKSLISKIIVTLKESNLKSIFFYIVKNNKVSLVKRDQDYYRSYYLYNVSIDKGDFVDCYLKVSSDIQLQIPITLNSPDNLLRTIGSVEMLSGLYLGIMVVMLLYNLFVFTASQDKSYLFYVNYIFWVGLTQASFLGIFQSLSIWGISISVSQILIFSGALSGIATVLFVREFLHTSVLVPKLDKYLYLIFVGDIIALLFLILGYPRQAYTIVNIVAGVGSFYVLLLAIIIHSKNYKPAKFFLIAWSLFLLSVIVFVLKDYELIEYNFFTVHAVQIGSALEAILLSFALANKINILIAENDKVQQDALKIATENEKIIREQNMLLEQKVDERTYELKYSNEELSKTLIDLQQTQSKLIESEKLASLGQLTAGIAHEINNPINFVTANISPLQRDIDILLKVTDHIESIGIEDIDSQKKQSKIEAYKNELDFDYLKIEIKQLLKGMYEGASRTADIVKGLRIFSREDDDSLKKADVNESLESTLIILNTLVDRIKIVKRYGTLPLLDCYPGKLNQVYLNIITNSIHAIKQKFVSGEGGELVIETFQTDGFLNVRIKDNGTGMEESTVRKLYEPFFTTKDVGEGTGLGMYISYNIIKRHNGEIVIDTKPGIGTSFTLQIPIGLTNSDTN